MKNKYIFITVLFLMALGFSCTDTSKYPVDFDLLNNSNAGTLKQIAQTSVSFDKYNMAGSKYEVLVEANDAGRGTIFTKVDLYVNYSDRTPTSTNGNNSKTEKLLKSFPASAFTKDATTGLPRLALTATATETLALLGLTATEVEGSDQFTFRQAMVFPDGRVFSSDNVQTAISSLGGVYKSPFANVVPVICPSDLGGTINYSTTLMTIGGGYGSCGDPEPVVGTTKFDVVANGFYDIEDASFGFWAQDCYQQGKSTGVQLIDACDILTIGGSDQYGDTYTWTIVSNNGTTLVIDWINTYGDSGRAALSRTGKTWPLTLVIP